MSILAFILRTKHWGSLQQSQRIRYIPLPNFMVSSEPTSDKLSTCEMSSHA